MQPLSPEDHVAAHVAATLTGELHEGDPEKFVAGYLLLVAPPKALKDHREAARAAREVAGLVVQDLPTPEGVRLTLADFAFSDGPVGTGGLAREMLFRARFAVNAAKRMYGALVDKGPAGLPAQFGREQAYFKAQKSTAKHREDAIGAIDDAAKRWGGEAGLLGWYARNSPTVTAECKAASGSNFLVGRPPKIGYPGLVHPQCLVGDTTVCGPPVRAAVARWYEGEVLDIRTVAGHHITVTPNHPILTPKGWIAAGLLDEGGSLLCCREPERMATYVYPDEHQVPALIEDVFEALGGTRGVASMSMPTASEDFHGDGIGSEVHVVRADGFLGDGFDAEFVVEPSLEQGFGRRDANLFTLSGKRVFPSGFEGDGFASSGGVGCLGVSAILGRRALGHHESVGALLVADRHVGVAQSRFYGTATDPEFLSQRVRRLPGDVGGNDFLVREVEALHEGERALGFTQASAFSGRSLEATLVKDLGERFSADTAIASRFLHTLAGFVEVDSVLHVGRRPFASHVYNLQTDSGWYIGNGIVTHNCRCHPGPPHPEASILK